MEARTAERIWRGLLPTAAVFSVGFEPELAVLYASERLSLPSAGPSRLREFAAGRFHARLAMAKLGHPAVDLRRGDDGAPQWPTGIVGSISHTLWRGRVFVVAAVARSNHVRALGVDLEAPGHIAPHVWHRLLTPAEMNMVTGLAVRERGEVVRAIWCAKEAAAKAGGGVASLNEIEVALIDGRPGRFLATLPQGAGPIDRASEGEVVAESGWLCAAVVCPAG